MKSLETLLKVAKRRLDDLGIEIAKLGQALDQMRVEEAAILGREQSEVEAASRDLSVMYLMTAYRQRVAHQVGALRARIAETEVTLELTRERLKAAYQEKSKFEELIDRERARVAATRAALEQGQLDEAAIVRAGRD